MPPERKIPPGPWDDEPRRDAWIDAATSLPCFAFRNSLGAWCAYVGVLQPHPLFDVSNEDSRAAALEVHGGVTWCGMIAEHGASSLLSETEPHRRAWFFGFDCAHVGDLVPAMIERPRRLRELPSDVYRDLAFVKRETEKLAAQLVAMVLQ